MLIVNNQLVATPFKSVNWRDKPALRPANEDYGKRAKKADGNVRQFEMVTIHSTSGIWPQEIRSGIGPSTQRPFNVVSSWQRDGRQAAAHLIFDFDGTAYQTADIFLEVTWHAQGMNHRSVGIECVQDPRGGGMYVGQLESVADACDWLATLPIEISLVQRQIPDGYHGAEPRFNIPNTDNTDWYGFVGHRVRPERGRGDPGDEIFDILEDRGYEKFNIGSRQDIEAWKARQAALGLKADGLPGFNTRKALLDSGKKYGLWCAPSVR